MAIFIFHISEVGLMEKIYIFTYEIHIIYEIYIIYKYIKGNICIYVACLYNINNFVSKYLCYTYIYITYKYII